MRGRIDAPKRGRGVPRLSSKPFPGSSLSTAPHGRRIGQTDGVSTEGGCQGGGSSAGSASARWASRSCRRMVPMGNPRRIAWLRNLSQVWRGTSVETCLVKMRTAGRPGVLWAFGEITTDSPKQGTPHPANPCQARFYTQPQQQQRDFFPLNDKKTASKKTRAVQGWGRTPR